MPVLEVLYFSDRDVKRKLFERVEGARGPLLVAQVRQDKHARPPHEREPFATLLRELGDVLDLLVVADEGTNEGMWRDPVGDLADHLFPEDRHAAYAAATGYMIIDRGEVKATTKKRGNAAEDLWLIQEALAAFVPGVPPPDPTKRPGKRKTAAAPKARRVEDEDTNPRGQAPAVRRNEESADPWAVIGVARGTPLADAKKVFRALVAQYHPDKVAHLAPEFRELADRKTRAILEAWRKIEEESG